MARSGIAVTLIESRRRLGGRATSFVDAASDEVLDNCQHVTLGCCTRYLELCGMLGVLDRFDWHDRQYWVLPQSRGEAHMSVLSPQWLPAPLQYAWSFLRAGFLTAGDKLAIAACLRELLVLDRSQWRDRTFGDFLRRLDQPPRAVRRFWEPVVVSACNLPCDLVCAESAMKVFQDGLLGPAEASKIGVPRVALVDLYESVGAILAESGGALRTGIAAASIEPGRVVTSSGEVLEADAVVAAIPVDRAAVLVKDRAGSSDARFAGLAQVVAFSPIVGVHLEFDRPVLTVPHAVLLECQTQWVFRKDLEGARLHAVISGATKMAEMDAESILGVVEGDLRRCFRREATGAVRLWGRVVKERRATFAATPAFERWRSRLAVPEHAGERVILAGDYTNTAWPATMEGAAISGFAAAQGVVSGCI
jgi:zeta-carotene desaturase